MESINNYLASIPGLENQKKPIQDKIEEIEESKNELEEQISALEEEIDDLDDEIEEQQDEIDRIDEIIEQGYLSSLRDPRAKIVEYLSEQCKGGAYSPLALDFAKEDPRSIVSISLKRMAISFCFPEIARREEDYGHVNIIIAPSDESIQPWMVVKSMKIMRDKGFLANLKETKTNRGYFYSYLLSANLDNQADVVSAKLIELSAIVEILDGPMQYEFPNDQ